MADVHGAEDARRFFEALDRRVEAEPKGVKDFMKGAGFSIEHTGGGCFAYEKQFGECHVWVTSLDPDGPSFLS